MGKFYTKSVLVVGGFVFRQTCRGIIRKCLGMLGGNPFGRREDLVGVLSVAVSDPIDNKLTDVT